MILGVGADAGFRKIIESTAVGICGRRASSSRKRASLICTSVSRQSQTMIEVSFKYEITKIWRLTCGLNCSFESNWLYSRLKLNVRPQTLLIHLAYMYSCYLVNQSLSRKKTKIVGFTLFLRFGAQRCGTFRIPLVSYSGSLFFSRCVPSVLVLFAILHT